VGQKAGVETVTLSVQQIPAHNHNVAASTTAADLPAVNTATALVATSGASYYGAASSLVALAPQSVGSTGSTQPHSNLQPYLATNYCISLTGIFPSRN
jgi:microcystin-dependent protein